MPKTSAIEYRDVAAACYALSQQGEPVSFQRVYVALGNRGAARVVNAHVQAWRKEVGEKLAMAFQRSLPGLPEQLVQLADELLMRIWQAALDAGETGYQEARAALEIERADWQHRIERTEAAARDEAQARRQVEVKLDAAQSNLAALEASLATLQQEHRDALIQLEEHGSQIAGLREDLARALTTLEAECKRADEQASLLQKQHAIELASERASAAGQRRFLMQTTDELRMAAKAKEADLVSQIEHNKAAADAYRGQLHKARDEAARWQGRAEAAETLLQRLTAKKQKKPMTSA